MKTYDLGRAFQLLDFTLGDEINYRFKNNTEFKKGMSFAMRRDIPDLTGDNLFFNSKKAIDKVKELIERYDGRLVRHLKQHIEKYNKDLTLST